MKIVVALALALVIGAACRWFEIPVPAPPRLLGALLILAVTVGYVVTDRWMARASGRPAVQSSGDLAP